MVLAQKGVIYPTQVSRLKNWIFGYMEGCKDVVAGIDGCRCGWVGFKVHLTSLNTSVELIDLSSILKGKPDDSAILAIDIPIGIAGRFQSM